MSRAVQMLMPLFLSACLVGAERIRVHDAEKAMEEESVPQLVSEAIQKAKAAASAALDNAKAHAKKVKENQEAAEKAKQQKAEAEAAQEQAATDAQQKATEASNAAKAAAQAAREAIASQQGWADAVRDRETAQDKLDAATKTYNEAHKHAQEENARLKQEVADAQAAMFKARSEAEDAQRNEDDKRIAHEAAQTKDESTVQALKGAQDTLAKANKFSKEKALSASVAGRDAEAAQMALETATTEHLEAKEKVKAAKALRDLLWDVYDAIEAFYRVISDLTRAMRKVEDDCEDDAHVCMLTGAAKDATETVLKRYNSMVLSFMTIKELHPSVYTELKPAGAELEKNAMAQIRLSCDPIMKLEKAGNAEDLDNKCGSGLWKKLDLAKNRFY